MMSRIEAQLRKIGLFGKREDTETIDKAAQPILGWLLDIWSRQCLERRKMCQKSFCEMICLGRSPLTMDYRLNQCSMRLLLRKSADLTRLN